MTVEEDAASRTGDGLEIPRVDATDPPYSSAAAGAASASFANSLVPMLVADGRRRLVAANRAACLLLRLSREEVLKLTVDELTPTDRRGDLDGRWEAFLRDGAQHGLELMMPGGPGMRVEYSATVNVEAGRHLAMLLLPSTEPPVAPDPPSRPPERLTARERQVLALIAVGNSGSEIAAALQISRSTVETHVRHCLTKLAAKNRAHAIALGLHRGEIELILSRDARECSVELSATAR